MEAEQRIAGMDDVPRDAPEDAIGRTLTAATAVHRALGPGLLELKTVAAITDVRLAQTIT
jgi:hypothetical protein